jgi:hypothetical protein
MFCGFAIFGSAKSPRAVHLGLLVAFGTFAFTSVRNIPLLGIAVTPVLARHLPAALGRTWGLMTRRTPLKGFFDRLHEKSVELENRSRASILSLILVAILIALFALPPSVPASYRAVTGIQRLSDLSPGFYPRGLIEVLKTRDANHRTFNYFNWGGAFIWALYPREKVFIDQRNDCYPLEVFKDYFAVHELEIDWQAVLDRWQIDSVAYPPQSRLAEQLRKDPTWRIEYEDRQAVLFTRPLKTAAR